MQRRLKRIGLLLLITVMISNFTACKNETNVPEKLSENSPAKVAEKKTLKLSALNGPTGMGMVKLMKDDEANEAKLDYEIDLVSSPDDLVGKVVNGEVDVAAVPANLAMVLYNKTGGKVQLAAVNTLGVLYLLENSSTIKSVNDLKGKTVNVSGKGSMPDFIFQYLLKKNQLEMDKDVKVEFKLQHAELAAALASGDVNIALLPQPHVTTAMMKNPNIRIALDITKEWEKVTDSQGELSMGAIIVQKEFAEKNKEALDTFLDEYSKSVDFVNTQDEASELIAKYGILPNAAVAKSAIPYSNIVYIDAQEAKASLQELYEVLFSLEPKSIGGKLGDEGFYYKK